MAGYPRTKELEKHKAFSATNYKFNQTVKCTLLLFKDKLDVTSASQGHVV